MILRDRKVPGVSPGSSLVIKDPCGTVTIQQFFHVTHDPEPPPEEMEAQARLYEAAPELLEAVKLSEAAIRLCIPPEAVALISKNEEAYSMLCEARMKLEEAKAKAEGQS